MTVWTKTDHANPDRPEGSETQVLITVEHDNGRRFAFEGYFLHRFQIDYWEGDRKFTNAKVEGGTEDGEYIDNPTISGWFFYNEDDDEAPYKPISATIVAWAYFPEPMTA